MPGCNLGRVAPFKFKSLKCAPFDLVVRSVDGLGRKDRQRAAGGVDRGGHEIQARNVGNAGPVLGSVLYSRVFGDSDEAL